MDTSTLVALAVAGGNIVALVATFRVMIGQMARDLNRMIVDFKEQSEKDRNLFKLLISETEKHLKEDHQRLYDLMDRNEREHRQAHKELLLTIREHRRTLND